jgi:hypothetical protein
VLDFLTRCRLIVTYFDRHMEFVLDSFSVKADDSSYFTKDGEGGKSLIVQFPELSGESGTSTMSR